MNEKLAVVVAHIDDAEIWAGGTLLNFSERAKINVYCLKTTDNLRINEAHLSEKQLGIQYIFWENDNDLYHLLKSFRPSILITHWYMDTHPEHLLVFQNVYRILPTLQIREHIMPNVYCMETYNCLGYNLSVPFNPTNFIDISQVWEKKKNVIQLFKSQPVQYWTNMIARQNSFFGAQVGVSYAEAFIQIPILGIRKCSRLYLEGNSCE